MSQNNRYAIRKTTIGVASILILGLIFTTTTLVSQFLGEENTKKKEEAIIEKKQEVENKKNAVSKDGKLITGEEVIENKTSEKENKIIPFKVIRKLSPNLLVGEEKVIVSGVNGFQEEEHIKTYHNNVLTHILTRSHITKEPVNQEILVGSKSIETKVENGVENLPIIYIEDHTLEEEKERLIDSGDNKEVQKIYKETRIEGQLVSRELVEVKTIKEGTPKKVARGTLKVATETITGIEIPISRSVTYVEDENVELVTPMQPKEIVKGSKVITPNAKSIMRTIRYVNENNQEISTPTVQSVSFDKTTWTNNSNVVWNTTQKFESISVKDITNYQTTMTIPELNVDHNTQNQELVIRYTTKTPVVVKEHKLTYYLENGGAYTLVQDLSLNLSTEDVKNKNILMKYVLNSMYEFVEIADRNHPTLFFNGDEHIIIIEKEKPFNIDTFVEEIKHLSEDERYLIAKSSMNTNVKKVNLELSQPEVDKIKVTLNEETFNNEVLESINHYRTLEGAKPLVISTELKVGTNQRAKEQAEIGYFRSIDDDGDTVGDRKHVRPDGKDFGTAFPFSTKVSLRSENASIYLFKDVRELLSEKYLAELQVARFRTSGEHNQSMMNKEYEVAYFSMGLSDDHLYLVENKTQTSREDKNGTAAIFIQAFGKMKATARPRP